MIERCSIVRQRFVNLQSAWTSRFALDVYVHILTRERISRPPWKFPTGQWIRSGWCARARKKEKKGASKKRRRDEGTGVTGTVAGKVGQDQRDSDEQESVGGIPLAPRDDNHLVSRARILGAEAYDPSVHLRARSISSPASKSSWRYHRVFVAISLHVSLTWVRMI